ncbi:MAG: HAD hydrolase-like protein, partial [Thermoplasmata archaeon]
MVPTPEPTPNSSPAAPEGPTSPSGDEPGTAGLPMVNPQSLGAGNAPPAWPREEELPPPRTVARGVVVFDLDGTLLDDMEAISDVAADVLHRAFRTPPAEGRRQYLATTGMPFEAQLAQLYPKTPESERIWAARIFHERKAREAYARAHLFPEIPGMVKRLDRAGWTLVVSTGAEREVAELLLEREGIRIWFEGVLGSAQGTKRDHLAEYRRRYSEPPLVLVGDSRFDLESSQFAGVPMFARTTRLPGWTVGEKDFRGWGAAWAGASLG